MNNQANNSSCILLEQVLYYPLLSNALLFCFDSDHKMRSLALSSIMSGSAGVAITTVLSIFVVIGIVGNCLVCAIIKKNRVMRYFHKPRYVEHTLFETFSEQALRSHD